MEIIGPLRRFGIFLKARQRWVLISLLAVLHLTLLAGADSTVGLMCWFVDVGFFLLWQPFIQTERRLDPGSLLLIAAALSAGAWLFGWWLLIMWSTVLAALLGGRVVLVSHRPTRIFYLLAFAYLLGAVLIWLVPKVVPDTSQIGPSLEKAFAWMAPLVFVAMLLMPRPRGVRRQSQGGVDFFYSLFIFLLVSVLVLGSLAFMLLRESIYIEAVFRTVAWMAALLLLIAWAWNPRPGFSGLGVFLSRHVLTVGLPFDTWLQGLMECSEQESDPDKFLNTTCERLLLDLPWVTGGAWSPVPGSEAGAGSFGKVSPFREEFCNRPLLLTFFTRHKLSPSLLWLLHLKARLVSEYYLAKWRARELQRMSYLRAVHETGARLTHDVKNLLQSLNNLCYMTQETAGRDEEESYRLLQRQLPQIAQRLQQTLEKLQVPGKEDGHRAGPGGEVAASAWWAILRQRFSSNNVVFEPVVFDPGARLPISLFDNVADNLLHNALIKRQVESGLQVRLSISADAARFSVCDNGSAVRKEIAEALLCAPVPSENGLGIGLYHAARQAEAAGYELRLAGNEEGRVCFELGKRQPA